MSDHSDWTEHPETVKFRKELTDRAQELRYKAYLHCRVTEEERMAVDILEQLVRLMDEEPVIESLEDVERQAERDGF